MQQLSQNFYRNSQVCEVAKQLLGKLLFTRIDGIETAVRIVETEAYEGVTDRASHAWNERRTERTKVLYEAGGIAYVYLCYGMHQMMNVVTGKLDEPHAVLLRAGEPVLGIDAMCQRTKKQVSNKTISRGPGNLCKALGINKMLNGQSLLSKTICIVDDGFTLPPKQIVASKRIGIDYAEEAVDWRYRFYMKNNDYVSG
jgi:DNA-3-methyladenine glycosylase